MDRQTNFRGVLGSIHHPKLWSVPVNIQKVLCPFNPQMDVFSGKFPLGEKKKHGLKTEDMSVKVQTILKKKKVTSEKKVENLLGFRICDLTCLLT